MVFEVIGSISVEVSIQRARTGVPKAREIAGKILAGIGVDSDCEEWWEPSH